MNVERWVRSRRPSWTELEELVSIIETRGISFLTSKQLTGLGRLYRSASADLSRARALNLSGDLLYYLNNLVVKAHNQVYQRRINRWTELWNFIWMDFPKLVQENILYIALATIIVLLPMLGSYLLVLHDLNFAHLEVTKGQPLVPEELWHMVEQHQMWTDSVQQCSPAMSGLIAANNIKVSILAFAYGITFGLGTVYVLFLNGMMIGTILGVCRTFGLDYRLLSFMAPHGVLELPAIFISGAAGFMMAGAILFPGQFSRVDALRRVAKRALGLFGGCVFLLLIAGIIEGFISPRTDITPEVKYIVSLASLTSLLVYLFAPRESMQKVDTPGSTGATIVR